MPWVATSEKDADAATPGKRPTHAARLFRACSTLLFLCLATLFTTATIGFEAKLWLTADTALRGSAFPQSEATPQVLSAAKNNMVALPGQLFRSTQIPVCLWFSGKNITLDSANDARWFDGETELSLASVTRGEKLSISIQKPWQHSA